MDRKFYGLSILPHGSVGIGTEALADGAGGNAKIMARTWLAVHQLLCADMHIQPVAVRMPPDAVGNPGTRCVQVFGFAGYRDTVVPAGVVLRRTVILIFRAAETHGEIPDAGYDNALWRALLALAG